MNPPGIERVSLEKYYPLPEGDAQFPFEYCEANGALVLERKDGGATVGVCDPGSDGLIESLKSVLGRATVFCRVDRSEFSSWLGSRTALPGASGTMEGKDDRVALDRMANDTPIVNFLNSVLIDAIRSAVSDIHLSLFDEGGVVRYRVDGRLQVARKFPVSMFQAVSSRIKIMANLNIMERRLPQDGRITANIDGLSIDMRVSTVPTTRGESIVLRVFGRETSARSLEELGMSASVLSAVRNLLKVPHGLVLATGPTGSGKTTTLNAMLREIRSDELKILTVEDPVECSLDGVDQIQTNDLIKLSFDTVLRRMLRQDPDIMMVGEIRDQATADLVVRAALTGHLVLSTLHTNDSVSAVARLRNIGVEPYLVGSTLRAVLAQRLVRRVCPHCRTLSPPSAGEAALFNRWGVAADSVPRAVGCPQCRNSGYIGRFALFELLENDADFESLISTGANSASLAHAARETGTVPLVVSALWRVAAGDTTIEEIEREVEL